MVRVLKQSTKLFHEAIDTCNCDAIGNGVGMTDPIETVT